jgi:hypothetical protein
MKTNELAIKTSELILFKTYQGLPLEKCEYQEIMDFFRELWNYLIDMLLKVFESIQSCLENVDWNQFKGVGGI